MQENANLQTPIRPWLAQFYTESCVLTIFLELVMLFEIANMNQFMFPFPVSKHISVNAYEAPDNVTK